MQPHMQCDKPDPPLTRTAPIVGHARSLSPRAGSPVIVGGCSEHADAQRGTRPAGRTLRRCARPARHGLPLKRRHVGSAAPVRNDGADCEQCGAEPLSAFPAAPTGAESELEGDQHADLRLHSRWRTATWSDDHPGRSDTAGIRFASPAGFSLVQCELRHPQCLRHPNWPERRNERHRLQPEWLHARDHPHARAPRGRAPLRGAHLSPRRAGVESPTADVMATVTRDG
jgi:hypothetical protein